MICKQCGEEINQVGAFSLDICNDCECNNINELLNGYVDEI